MNCSTSQVLFCTVGLLLLGGCATTGANQRPEDHPSPARLEYKKPIRHGNLLRKGTPEMREIDEAVYYFALGQAYSLDGEGERSIEAYRLTLIHDPNSALVHARLAAELVKQGNLSEAKEVCARAIVLDPDYEDAYLLLAGIQVVSKEFDAALKTYEKILKRTPTSRDALLYYGTTLAESGHMKRALVVLNRLVRLEDDPDSQVDAAVSWYYLAKVQMQLDRFSKATFSLRQAIRKRPGFSKAALFLSDIYLAQEKPKKSIKVLISAYEENDHPSIAARLGAHYLSKSQFEQAVPYLETVAEAESDNMSTRIRLALVYWQVNWLDKAYAALWDVYKQFPQSNEILYYLGELELERNNLAEAVVFFRKISPTYARFEDTVGRTVAAYQRLKDSSAAKEYLVESIKFRRDLVSFYSILARIYEEEGDHKEAILVLERNRSAISNEESSLYYLGFLYDYVGRKKEGIALMEEILRINSDNANALNYIGYSLLEEGTNLLEAEKYLGKALALKPNDAYIIDSYGWLLFKMGKKKIALKRLEKAKRLRPEEPVIVEHLADVYLDLNLRLKALDTFKQAVGLFREPKDLNRIKIKIRNVEAAIAAAGERRPRVPASKRNSKPKKK